MIINERIEGNKKITEYENGTIIEVVIPIEREVSLSIEELKQQKIEELKQQKIEEINKAADAQLALGFDSDALGTIHRYPNNGKFPQWYRDKMAIQNSKSPDLTVDWLTDKGMITHTAEQFNKVFKDLIDFEQPIEYKRLSLLLSIESSDEESISTIEW